MQWLNWAIYQNYNEVWGQLLQHIFCMTFHTPSIDKVSLSYIFYFPRYQTKCVIKFFVFGNTDQIAKKMQGSTHPCFQNFIKKPSTDSYIEGLYKSLKSLNIGGPSKPATSKRKLLELLDESDSSSSEQKHAAGSSKKKKHLCSDNSELEEVSPVLRSSSISDEVFEPLQAEETSSKVMKKKKKKQKKSKRQ